MSDAAINEVLAELTAAGATADVLQVAVGIIFGLEIDRCTLSQRARRARERRERIDAQAKVRPSLKAETIKAFLATCSYCDRAGTETADPDGQPWALDRIYPGKFGGEYTPENVTLACKRCNGVKGANWPLSQLPRSLAEVVQ